MSIEENNIDNSPVETEESLADFKAQLWPESVAPSEPASLEVTDDDAEEIDAPLDEDTHLNDDVVEEEDIVANDDDEDDETDKVVEEAPKPKKKNRFQERIDELTAKAREAERRVQELEKRLAQPIPQTPEPTPVAPPVVVDDKPPSPTDLNEDGTEKYPLGEFDPQLMRDTVKYTLEQERKEQEAQKQQQEQARAQAELEASWAEKLAPAQERYPDFQEKGLNLVETFNGIDDAYGQYLTTTLMQMEYGPDVLYYLANNVDEAKRIVNSGARQATIALGRLEAKFAEAAEEKQRARPKVSKAPAPPVNVVKGNGVAKPVVRGDEDDLTLVKQALFGSKKR